MSFSAEDVKKLREKTGCGMMDCKKALAHSGGDESKAIDFLREKGLATAAKKAGRIASEGMAFAMSTSGGGALIEVNSETDFVAKNNEFKDFVKLCAECVLKNKPSDVESLLKVTPESFSKNLNEVLNEKILKIGENIKIRRFKFLDGVTSSYIHADGKIAVLVKFDADSGIFGNEVFQKMSKDIAMQIAAINPLYLSKNEVPSNVLEHEKKILMEQAKAQGKPEQIAQRMVEGRIGKYFKENCLLHQEFVKDSSLTVAQYVDKISSAVGQKIAVSQFVRYERGEGLEKKDENFAQEVSKILG